MDNKRRWSGELRRKAEELLEALGDESQSAAKAVSAEHQNVQSDTGRPDTEKIKNLLHELQVHQMELEVQNEELKESQEEAWAAWERYRELFEHAPVGYVVINSDHLAVEANQEALNLLEAPEQSLKKTAFSRLIAKEDRDEFARCIKRCREKGTREQCEITLGSSGKDGRHLQLNVFPQRRPTGLLHYLLALNDITPLKTTEAKLSQQLGEKEVLLKEIHHRVKNNLNVVSSLLRLQAGSINTQEQAEEALLSSCNRINSMVAVHRQLYESESLAGINMGDYLQTLIHELSFLHSTRTRKPAIETNVENVTLTINQAVPVGLILNELITNALKHAFPDPGEDDRIAVSITELQPGSTEPAGERTAVELTVEDNGRGFPEELVSAPQLVETLGMKLVTVLTEQLEGELSFITGAGANETKGLGNGVRIRFPKKHPG